MDSFQSLPAGPHLVKRSVIHYQSLGLSFIMEQDRGGLAGNRRCPLCLLAVQQHPVTCHYYNRKCVPSSRLAPICYHSPGCQGGGEWVQPCAEMEQTAQYRPEEGWEEGRELFCSGDFRIRTGR